MVNNNELGVGVFITLCPICLNETGIAIDPVLKKKYNNDYGKKFVLDKYPCDKCNKYLKDGYSAVIEVKNKGIKNITFENAERTGKMLFVKKDVVNNIHPIVFCEIGVIDKLVGGYKKSVGEEPKEATD